MDTASPPVSPSVVAAILRIQKSRVTSGTLLMRRSFAGFTSSPLDLLGFGTHGAWGRSGVLASNSKYFVAPPPAPLDNCTNVQYPSLRHEEANSTQDPWCGAQAPPLTPGDGSRPPRGDPRLHLGVAPRPRLPAYDPGDRDRAGDRLHERCSLLPRPTGTVGEDPPRPMDVAGDRAANGGAGRNRAARGCIPLRPPRPRIFRNPDLGPRGRRRADPCRRKHRGRAHRGRRVRAAR